MKDRIRGIRKSEHLTQTEFGKRIGASRAMIASYEGGAVIPSEPILKLIAREFNVSYNWLKNGDSDGLRMHEESRFQISESEATLPERLRILADALESMGPEWNRKLEKAIKTAEQRRRNGRNSEEE